MDSESISTRPGSAQEEAETVFPVELKRVTDSLTAHSIRLDNIDGVLREIKLSTDKTLRAIVGEPDLKRPGLVDIAESNIARIGRLETSRETAKNEVKGGLKTITSVGSFLAWGAGVTIGLVATIDLIKWFATHVSAHP
jgi:hypothetical protein